MVPVGNQIKMENKRNKKKEKKKENKKYPYKKGGKNRTQKWKS